MRALGPPTVVVAALATWFLMGDRTVDIPDPDYFLGPVPSPPRAIELLLGVVALGLVGVLLARSNSHGGARSTLALLAMVMLGGYVGFTARVWTAGVGGANIGAGLLLFAAVPVVPALLATWWFSSRQKT